MHGCDGHFRGTLTGCLSASSLSAKTMPAVCLSTERGGECLHMRQFLCRFFLRFRAWVCLVLLVAAKAIARVTSYLLCLRDVSFG
jgi:hypothetical protein